MVRYARVAIESDLIQLDREFDYLIPEHLQAQVAIGQRVRLTLGRTKKLQTGFVVDLMETSEFAKTELSEIVDEKPVLTKDVYEFCKLVAARQCVATGELLQTAVPDHMPRIELVQAAPALIPHIEFPTLPEIAQRVAVLTSARHITNEAGRFPDWAWLFAKAAFDQIAKKKSSILVLPEVDQVNLLCELLGKIGLGELTIKYVPGGRKSERFIGFNQVLDAELSIVVGTRSAIFAPANNLSLIALFDDADDSLREPGSPFTHVRELAMMRARQDTQLLFAANYRSLEIQRLVEIGYLSDLQLQLPPARISFSDDRSRMDSASFNLIRQSLEKGPVLILIPRKGESATLYCTGCDSRLRCKRCGGPMWEPKSGRYECRLCKSFAIGCDNCGSNQLRRGRTGSTRTAAEIGKAFPGATISEATADKRPVKIKPKNHIVIATPGAAPRVTSGYRAVIILDTDVWLSVPLIRAEQNAIRDWMEAIELLSDDGRAHLSSIPSELGSAISLQQFRALATRALSELGVLKLPPTTRVVTLQSDPQTVKMAIENLTQIGAELLRSDLGDDASALMRFAYSKGTEVSASLKALALKTNARLVGGQKRRGLRIVMDDPVAL